MPGVTARIRLDKKDDVSMGDTEPGLILGAMWLRRLLRSLLWAWPVCTQPRRARYVDAEQAPYHLFVLYQALVILSMLDLQ